MMDSPCIEWTRYITPQGYGQEWYEGRDQLAHRVAYKKHVGEIPPGHHVHHVCRNRRCVNPLHLRVVSSSHHPAEHASAVCPTCGGTRRKQLYTREGRRRGIRCLDCHARINHASYHRNKTARS